VQKYGVKYLSIQDELFGYNMARVRAFCERIKKYDINWLAQFRVTDITPELVSLLKDSNCSTIGFGIESAHNDILKSMKKQITIEQTNKALELVHDAGIGIQGVLIFGDKAETIETAKTSLNWWMEHIHYDIQLSAIITYPGTEIYKYALSRGIISDPVQFIKDGCPLVRLSNMTDDQYNWLFDQLASLPRLTHKTPINPKITNIDYENANINISGDCAVCNINNNWNKVRLFILETLQCRKCGARHIAPIPNEVATRVSNNLNKLVCKFGNIALWGINSYVHALAEMLNIESKEHIFFVDKSVMRQGLNVSGNSILSDQVLNDKSIKCVVVLVVQYYAGLIKPIKDEYQTVKHVLSISRLLSDDIIRDINE
jgi:anaerobic magnesium-protoporphyrin IX monomethyl ester cyclase